MRNTAMRWGAGADTDDLVQETWLRLWLHLDRLRQPAALPAWLCKTVRNLCHSRARRLGRARQLPLEPEQTGEAAPPDTVDPCMDHVVATNEADVLHRALDRLSDRDRQLAHFVMEPELLRRDQPCPRHADGQHRPHPGAHAPAAGDEQRGPPPPPGGLTGP